MPSRSLLHCHSLEMLGQEHGMKTTIAFPQYPKGMFTTSTNTNTKPFTHLPTPLTFENPNYPQKSPKHLAKKEVKATAHLLKSHQTHTPSKPSQNQKVYLPTYMHSLISPPQVSKRHTRYTEKLMNISW